MGGYEKNFIGGDKNFLHHYYNINSHLVNTLEVSYKFPSIFLKKYCYTLYHFSMKTIEIKKYIFRLQCCGYTMETATQTCFDFLRDFTISELEDFINSMEAEYVDRVQP